MIRISLTGGDIAGINAVVAERIAHAEKKHPDAGATAHGRYMAVYDELGECEDALEAEEYEALMYEYADVIATAYRAMAHLKYIYHISYWAGAK